MTRSEFQGLPALLTRDRMKAITGWSDADIRALVAAGTLSAWKRPGKGRKLKGHKYSGQERGPYGRYYTVEVARLCGVEL